MKRSTCETCQAFNVMQSQCRRHKPDTVPVPQQGPGGQVVGMASFGIYPATTKDEWCMEHIPIALAGLH